MTYRGEGGGEHTAAAAAGAVFMSAGMAIWSEGSKGKRELAIMSERGRHVPFIKGQ